MVKIRMILDGDHQVLSSAGKMDAVSQMPVVLLPIHFDRLETFRLKED